MLLHMTGLVAIRYGCQTVDPVTGVVAPVVGVRLDVTRKITVPITASYWLTVGDQTDSVQVGMYKLSLILNLTQVLALVLA